MAVTTSFPKPSLLDSLRGLLGRRVEDHVEARARFRDYMRTHAELAGMSDRALADLGLGRSDISTAAYEHAYGGMTGRA